VQLVPGAEHLNICSKLKVEGVLKVQSTVILN